MGKEGFSPKISAIFIQFKKKTLEKKFVIEWYQILIINYKTDL